MMGKDGDSEGEGNGKRGQMESMILDQDGEDASAT